MNDVSSKRSGLGIGEAGRVPATDIEAELEAERIQPTPPATVQCDCGHTVPRSWAMWASRGSACPDCYDRMSD